MTGKLTQGYEELVLRGATESLSRIDTIQIEMSFVALYGGQKLFVEICEFVREQEYSLVGLEPGFVDPTTGRMLQADGLFRRESADPLGRP